MAKVCVLTAGRGTRMGVYGEYANKAILPLNFKALLTHIVDSFPVNTEYVIALGYLKTQVISYLKIVHPSLKVEFVDVDNFDGAGSGPGYSLQCCSKQLQEPFYFVACDTLWNNKLSLNEEYNWFGVSKVNEEESSLYCNFELKNNKILNIKDKQRVSSGNHAAFVGLCYIYDYEIFWQGFKDQKTVAGEVQVSNGLNALVEQSTVVSKDIDWIDLGDYEKYKTEISKYENYDFSKSDEFLYIVNNKVIKFFSDKDISDKRVYKSKLKSNVFPVITEHEPQFYAYSFLNGETMYAQNGPDKFKKFLSFMDEKVWNVQHDFSTGKISSICKKFYFDKTMNRVEKFKIKYPDYREPSLIRGVEVPMLNELLNQIPWPEFYDGLPSFIHGDLQFDNILSTKEDDFTLLDWRHEFGGEVEVGDLYYDLGKLSGGILLNYDYIKQNLLTYEESSSTIEFDFATRFGGHEYTTILENFIEKKGWSVRKVRLLVPIIYLNMSPLHHYPFDKMLFALGKLMLFQRLNERLT